MLIQYRFHITFMVFQAASRSMSYCFSLLLLATWLLDRLEIVDDGVELRWRCKTGGSSSGVPSPRNLWWSTRQIEHEESEFVQVYEVVKPRKRRKSGKSRTEKNTSIPSAPASDENVGEESTLYRMGQMIWQLVMWRDTAKSSLWFGFGCICFLSSCFTKRKCPDDL